MRVPILISALLLGQLATAERDERAEEFWQDEGAEEHKTTPPEGAVQTIGQIVKAAKDHKEIQASKEEQERKEWEDKKERQKRDKKNKEDAAMEELKKGPKKHGML
mmetsp:Transcript_35570/g.48460  ORF Transcript_35570/g.48460 Transcript_35570/m.48460 type:complete len:106 (+) Transcript_35570:63-380(+)